MITHSPRPYTPEELGVKVKPRHRSRLDTAVQAFRIFGEIFIVIILVVLLLKIIGLLFS
jgi:hypothetical protein